MWPEAISDWIRETAATLGRGDPQGRGWQHGEVGDGLRGVYPRVNVGHMAEPQAKDGYPSIRRAGAYAATSNRHVRLANPGVPWGMLPSHTSGISVQDGEE